MLKQGVGQCTQPTCQRRWSDNPRLFECSDSSSSRGPWNGRWHTPWARTSMLGSCWELAVCCTRAASGLEKAKACQAEQLLSSSASTHPHCTARALEAHSCMAPIDTTRATGACPYPLRPARARGRTPQGQLTPPGRRMAAGALVPPPTARGAGRPRATSGVQRHYNLLGTRGGPLRGRPRSREATHQGRREGP